MTVIYVAPTWIIIISVERFQLHATTIRQLFHKKTTNKQVKLTKEINLHSYVLTFIRYRPDVHARWVETEHSAKKTAFFLCACSRNCLYNHLQLVMGEIYHWFIVEM